MKGEFGTAGQSAGAFTAAMSRGWADLARRHQVYTFGKHVIRHQFCKTCGCAPFAEGTGPDGNAMVVINLRCAENIDLATIRITQFDGASL